MMKKNITVNELMVPSLLDRLIDDNPDQNQEIAYDHLQNLMQYRQSICHDIENLLNTFTTMESETPFDALKQSLINYGICDFSSYDFESPTTKDLVEQEIKNSLKNFEPRLKNIQITWLDLNSSNQISTLQFRIEAELLIESLPKVIVLNSMLNPMTGNFSIASSEHE